MRIDMRRPYHASYKKESAAADEVGHEALFVNQGFTPAVLILGLGSQTPLWGLMRQSLVHTMCGGSPFF